MEDADYIVLGAGSAGCVVANRLSADPGSTVLLVEAGKRSHNPFVAMPRGVGRVLGTPDLLWMMPVGGSETQAGTTAETWTRGRLHGGTSCVNGMIYMRGFPRVYDELELDGWRWEDIGPVFRAIENHELGAAEWRGANGPLRLSVHHARQPLCEAFISALEQLGIPRLLDYNEAQGECVAYPPRTIWRGRRQTADRVFLDPVRHRPNLDILGETLVRRLVWEGRRAIGVEIERGGEISILRCRREIIVSLGTINTPKLLLLSGLGRACALRAAGVTPLVEAGEVGTNLIEKRGFLLTCRVRHGSDNREFRGARLYANILRYACLGSGPLTHAAFEVAALVRTRCDAARPEGKVSFGPFSLHQSATGVAADELPGASASCFPMHPRSRGTISLTSPDPRASPLIHPNYLSDPYDQRTVIDLLRVTRHIFAQPALARFEPREITPGSNVSTDDEILAACSEAGISASHAVGSCRMGADKESVVDTRLRVRGVRGLRIADISVLPRMLGANTSAPAMAIGWRAAQFCLEDAAISAVRPR